MIKFEFCLQLGLCRQIDKPVSVSDMLLKVQEASLNLVRGCRYFFFFFTDSAAALLNVKIV